MTTCTADTAMDHPQYTNLSAALATLPDPCQDSINVVSLLVTTPVEHTL